MGTPGIPLFGKQGSLLEVEKYPAVKRELADFFGPGAGAGEVQGLALRPELLHRHGRHAVPQGPLAREGLPTDRKSLPKTWEQFREWGRKLAKWEGGTMTRIGFNVPRDDKMFLTAVNQLGKSLFNKELTQANFGGPEGERALQMVVDLMHRDRVDAWASSAPSCRRGSTSWARGCAPAGTAARRGWPRSAPRGSTRRS